ncbi:MAG TPA: DUF134 domain-containing protein [Candidatus Gracilibacteria bacterium]|nr:DUF134 domain-containing protein [Candidatus Gracilibacteria bacterium]
MNRPRLQRKLNFFPNVTFYKPQGVPLHDLKILEISHEEWEALRLKHLEKLEQIEIAEKMQTSQSTVQRILASAHQKIAEAIVNGLAIKIVK